MKAGDGLFTPPVALMLAVELLVRERVVPPTRAPIKDLRMAILRVGTAEVQ